MFRTSWFRAAALSAASVVLGCVFSVAAESTRSGPVTRTTEERSAGPRTSPSASAAKDDIDWDRAKRIYQRFQRGDSVSKEDREYLEKAKQARQGGRGPAAQGSPQPKVPPATAHTGLVPLDQMTADEHYKGEDGGLYGGGKNVPPEAHQKAAERESAQVVPRDAEGRPSPDGKIVLLSLGMSNTTQEFSMFKQMADKDPQKSPRVVIVNGAQGGQDAERWSEAGMPAWRTAGNRLRMAGVTPRQVQVLFVKHARIGPARFGEYPKHAEELKGHVAASLQIARQKFPNLRVAYLTSRIYAGYAVTGLNPEPYAYESGLAVRSLIGEQIAGSAKLNYDPAKGNVKAPCSSGALICGATAPRHAGATAWSGPARTLWATARTRATPAARKWPR